MSQTERQCWPLPCFVSSCLINLWSSAGHKSWVIEGGDNGASHCVLANRMSLGSWDSPKWSRGMLTLGCQVQLPKYMTNYITSKILRSVIEQSLTLRYQWSLQARIPNGSQTLFLKFSYFIEPWPSNVWRAIFLPLSCSHSIFWIYYFKIRFH